MKGRNMISEFMILQSVKQSKTIGADLEKIMTAFVRANGYSKALKLNKLEFHLLRAFRENSIGRCSRSQLFKQINRFWIAKVVKRFWAKTYFENLWQVSKLRPTITTSLGLVLSSECAIACVEILMNVLTWREQSTTSISSQLAINSKANFRKMHFASLNKPSNRSSVGLSCGRAVKGEREPKIA